MATRIDGPLLLRWSRVLADAGIDLVSLLANAEDDASFGNGEASYAWRTLILHFVRDRGQEFIDIAPAHKALERFKLDDMGVVLGWRRNEEIIARSEPRSLADELADVTRHRDQLETALSVQGIAATRLAAELAAAERERMLLDKLRRLAGPSG